ncbi:alpha-amylase [Methylobacillus rhizosphaerae]|uniref:Alpha-amylase n=1 Tax=Methylobacillus rhizosphaerae TaxID=551994 RepID=A0A238ZKY9_9PROT|nr:alpha-amylase/4-alpha-glucanotransferase domain-containing protein [Methylobacillus rhizosphaerae]SNR84065.1 alpha-amylase [Methylobacillus rhizosphaerae]
MAKTVALLLGVHAHQPVGNFTSVLDDAHARCYGPFLRTVHEYPDFHFAIHISGWLLDYMIQHFPEDMALLRDMVARGQAELFGAGFTEPVLASIPVKDRIGQINTLSHRLKQAFGEVPQGAWLTERVWESTVVPALVDAGIRYVTVDDYHFMCTGHATNKLDGFYTTEEDGRQLDLFPISEALRYRLPFSPAHEVVEYLESLAQEDGQAAAVYFDDIEKFGIWPETYQWVYERGWLRQFIEGVLASDIIKPMRYCDYHQQAKKRGVVYLPTTSYIEMNEWTLPVPAAHHYADLVEQERQQQRYETSKPFVRGGIWRNFLMRYPESNWMHKRMLALSARYHALPEKQQTAEMLQALYEAQANDAYWHGLFGGLYLPHLRRAVYQALVRLESLLDEVEARSPQQVMDIDLDGHDEFFMQNGCLQAVIRLDGTASIAEFDSYKLKHNFADTLTRQTEHYHRRIHAAPEHQQQGGGISNPHEQMASKHEITPADLIVDEYRKALFCDSWHDHQGTSHRLQYMRDEHGGPGCEFAASLPGQASLLRKTFNLEQNQLVVQYTFASQELLEGRLRVELNLAMPSCDGPAGRFRQDEHILGGFGQPLVMENFQQLFLDDEVLGGTLELSSSIPCHYFSHPHFSVSQSEAGFEKVMQAVTIVLEWPVEQLGQEIFVHLKAI